MALRGFGQSVAGSVTMATPFVGYLILYHDAIRPYLGGLGGLLANDAGRCGPMIGFETRLHLLYFGLLCLGLGTIIYRIFADREIKTHSGVSDYVARNAAHVTVRNLRSMYVTIRSRRSDMAALLHARGKWLDRKEEKNLGAAVSRAGEGDAELKNDVMRSYFNVLDRYTARPWAWAAYGLYAAGFFLLGVPGVLFTLRVLCTIVSP